MVLYLHGIFPEVNHGLWLLGAYGRPIRHHAHFPTITFSGAPLTLLGSMWDSSRNRKESDEYGSNNGRPHLVISRQKEAIFKGIPIDHTSALSALSYLCRPPLVSSTIAQLGAWYPRANPLESGGNYGVLSSCKDAASLLLIVSLQNTECLHLNFSITPNQNCRVGRVVDVPYLRGRIFSGLSGLQRS